MRPSALVKLRGHLPACARRAGFPLLLALLSSCQAPPAQLSCRDPGASVSSRSNKRALVKQIAADSSLEMFRHPLKTSRRMATSEMRKLNSAAVGIFGKRLKMRLLGMPGPVPCCQGTLDPEALEESLQHKLKSALQPVNVQLYTDGGESLAALKHVIDQATCRIDVLMYQWEDDLVGRTVASWLAAKASPTLHVRVLVDGGGNLTFGGPDGKGTGDVNRTVCDLARQPYVTLLRTRNPFICFDHRKLVLVDSRLVWSGGRNFTHPCFFEQHDVSYTLTGDLVPELQDRYEKFWRDQGGKPEAPIMAGLETEVPVIENAQDGVPEVQTTTDGLEKLPRIQEGSEDSKPLPPLHGGTSEESEPLEYLPVSVDPESEKLPALNTHETSADVKMAPMPFEEPNAFARLVSSSPDEHTLAKAIYEVVGHAHHHIYLENFCPWDNKLIVELAKARHRGVDVRVVLTLTSDTASIPRMNKIITNRLLNAGIRVYVYPEFTHTKAAAVDGCWAYFGTGNFDRLSLRKNREFGLAIGAGTAIEDVEEIIFLPDFRPEWEVTEPFKLSPTDRFYEILGCNLM